MFASQPHALPSQPYTAAAPPARATARANLVVLLNALALQPTCVPLMVPPSALSVDALALLEDVLCSPAVCALLAYNRMDERVHQHVQRLRSDAVTQAYPSAPPAPAPAPPLAPAHTIVTRPGAAPIPMPSIKTKSCFPIEQRAVLEHAYKGDINISNKQMISNLVRHVNACVNQATGEPLKPMTETQVKNWLLNKRKAQKRKTSKQNPWSESDDEDAAIAGLKAK